MSPNNRKKKEIISNIETEVVEPIETLVENAVDEKIASKAKVTNCTRVRFRAEPDGDVLSILEAGTKVDVLEQDGAWSFVSVADEHGYIMTEFLEVE